MNTALAFSGPWVGESMGCDSPAHLWEITISNFGASVSTCWEGETTRQRFWATLVDDGDGTALDLGKKRAVMIDPQHFVVPKWDTNNVRGNKGPAYDVVFSRPGVAELSAHDAYRRFLELKKAKSPKKAKSSAPKAL